MAIPAVESTVGGGVKSGPVRYEDLIFCLGLVSGPLSVTVAAQAHSDIFIDPGDGFANGGPGGDAGTSLNAESMLNAATLLGAPPDGDFQFSARVTVGFASTFDAGVFVLWLDERRWAERLADLRDGS